MHMTQLLRVDGTPEFLLHFRDSMILRPRRRDRTFNGASLITAEFEGTRADLAFFFFQD